MNPHNPITQVVIIVKENHTFDNYFGTFPGANGDGTLAHAPDPPASDPPHDHAAWLKRATNAVRQQYHQADIPDYFTLAQQYTLCDNYFTNVASQSEPNHLMLIAADSPIIDNSSAHRTYQPQAPFNLKSLPDLLTKAKLTWKTYGDPSFSYFTHLASLKGSKNILSWTQFDKDAAAGKLPNVSWVYAPSGFSEHPPYGANAGKPSVKLGMQWTMARIKAAMQSKQWATMAILLTWDDWGGWYDHVEPKEIETWKGGGPTGYTGSQFSYGPRVPCLVMSPYAKKGYISKTFHSHVSVVKFCETTFGLTTLSARDAASDDLTDCFDFKQKPVPPKPNPKPKPKPKPKKKSATEKTPHTK